MPRILYVKNLNYARQAKKVARQGRGGVVGEEGAETGKCATILCRTLMCSNCARQAHYEPSLTSEQWGHSASSASTQCLLQEKGKIKVVACSLCPTSSLKDQTTLSFLGQDYCPKNFMYLKKDSE